MSPRPVGDSLCNVWAVIPAYNESAVISNVILELKRLGPRIVVVDDGSTDDTADAVRSTGVTLLRHAVNLGQGAALQTGIDYCLKKRAVYICTYDADGQHSPESVAALLERLLSTGSDIALGSRTLGTAERIPPIRRLVLKAAVFFTRFHSGLSVTDTHNGLRLMTARAAMVLKLTQPRMAHASEILHLIGAHRLKYVEVPVTVRYTPYSLGKGQSLTGAFRIIADLFYASWTR